MTVAPHPPPGAQADHESAAERILRATAQRIQEGGAAKLSMHDVAGAAGVSKGLIHYHFQDKDTLLVRVVEWLTAELVRREHAALEGRTAQTVIDALWRWLEGELARGALRVLLELGAYQSAPVQRAIRRSALERRAATAHTVETLFTVLGLRPRVPAMLLADVTVAFINGIALQHRVLPDAEPRVAFDVFWLSLLNLVE